MWVFSLQSSGLVSLFPKLCPSNWALSLPNFQTILQINLISKSKFEFTLYHIQSKILSFRKSFNVLCTLVRASFSCFMSVIFHAVFLSHQRSHLSKHTFIPLCWLSCLSICLNALLSSYLGQAPFKSSLWPYSVLWRQFIIPLTVLQRHIN